LRSHRSTGPVAALDATATYKSEHGVHLVAATPDCRIALCVNETAVPSGASALNRTVRTILALFQFALDPLAEWLCTDP
jgi:hypothetical protein